MTVWVLVVWLVTGQAMQLEDTDILVFEKQDRCLSARDAWNEQAVLKPYKSMAACYPLKIGENA